MREMIKIFFPTPHLVDFSEWGEKKNIETLECLILLHLSDYQTEVNETKKIKSSAEI